MCSHACLCRQRHLIGARGILSICRLLLVLPKSHSSVTSSKCQSQVRLGDIYGVGSRVWGYVLFDLPGENVLVLNSLPAITELPGTTVFKVL
ncbi:hypothetical protein BKA70DRAFT_741714 [Coprinopsis sp. MPI-PUGE-AT-0042]|nr:hypothetical protein BKA70DRAFT_741714 [Coprinopsis sp. MPI-PUGE-AT-0042]